MPRDERAYLTDIIAACQAIEAALDDLDLPGYQDNRLVRSAVEREFIIIGEALRTLSDTAPEVFAQVTHGRRIIDFRNLLTHEYATVDDALVWAIALRDVPTLLKECSKLLEEA